MPTNPINILYNLCEEIVAARTANVSRYIKARELAAASGLSLEAVLENMPKLAETGYSIASKRGPSGGYFPKPGLAVLLDSQIHHTGYGSTLAGGLSGDISRGVRDLAELGREIRVLRSAARDESHVAEVLRDASEDLTHVQ